MALRRIGLAVVSTLASPAAAQQAPAPTNTTLPAPNSAEPAQSLAALRQQVTNNPDDARAWFQLAITYREAGVFDQAEQAFRRTTELEPRNVRNAAYLAESLLLQETEPKRREARQLLDRAAQIDAAEPMVRFYRAALKDLDGDHVGAVDDLIALVRDVPAGASWEPQVREAVRMIADANRIDIASRLPVGRPATASDVTIPGQMAKASALPPPAAKQALAPAAPQQAPSQDRTVHVRFAPGSTGAQYRGTLRGDQGINYVVRAQRGQRLTVQLRTGNPFAYFNIWAPGADTAAFIGSQGASETDATGGGYSHDMPVTVSGEQRIQVYLMRNAARRGERANFTIDIAVYGESEAPPR